MPALCPLYPLLCLMSRCVVVVCVCGQCNTPLHTWLTVNAVIRLIESLQLAVGGGTGLRKADGCLCFRAFAADGHTPRSNCAYSLLKFVAVALVIVDLIWMVLGSVWAFQTNTDFCPDTLYYLVCAQTLSSALIV
jgi:hypothetical protein